MNLIKFLDEFTTDKLQEPNTSRRAMFGQLGSLTKKAAIAAVPFGLATMSNKAMAQTNNDSLSVPEVLNLALTLEYLEDEFYAMALDSGVLSSNARAEAIFMQISKHEAQHVTFLTDTLNSLEATIDPKPTFDFTGGGAFDPFNNDNPDASAQLLALAQAFEDTGVRAYKGQAGNLMGSPGVLTAALQIHSVEARHASEIRRLRGLEGWITGDERGAGMPAPTQPVYNGEDNVEQGGVDVTTLGTGSPFTVDASTQAYDEILTSGEAVAIASLFIES